MCRDRSAGMEEHRRDTNVQVPPGWPLVSSRESLRMGTQATEERWVEVISTGAEDRLRRLMLLCVIRQIRERERRETGECGGTRNR